MVLLLLKIVDLSDKVHIFLHHLFVDLFVSLVNCSLFLFKVLNSTFQLLTKFLKFNSVVRIVLTFCFNFLSYILLVQSNDRLFQFFVIRDVV